MVSPEEARSMLAEAKEKGEFKFLFPQFDMQGINSLSVENKKTSPTSKVMRILISGIPVGKVFKANFDGQAWPGAVGVIPPATEISGKVDDNTTLVLQIPRVGHNPTLIGPFLAPDSAGYPVTIGTPLANLETDVPLAEGYVPGGNQVSFFVRTRNPDGTYDFSKATLRNVLMKDGRIAMVEAGK